MQCSKCGVNNFNVINSFGHLKIECNKCNAYYFFDYNNKKFKLKNKPESYSKEKKEKKNN